MLAHAEASLGKAAQNAKPSHRSMKGFATANKDLTAAVEDARAKVESLSAKVAATPGRVPVASIRPEATVLDEERKLVTHAIRMATYNAESALARMLIGEFPMDEARALLREAFNSPGDLEVTGSALYIRIDPLSAPRRTRALAALCEKLIDAEITYPGTNLVLHYSVKDAPGITST